MLPFFAKVQIPMSMERRDIQAQIFEQYYFWNNKFQTIYNDKQQHILIESSIIRNIL